MKRKTTLVVQCTALLAVAACGSSGSGDNQAYSQRFADAPALLTQCVIERDSLPIGASAEQWFSRADEAIHITGSTAASFLAWFNTHDSGVVAGKSLASWRQWSAQNNALPTSVCGSDAADPAGMQEQIFSQDPFAGTPWSK